MTRRTVRQFCFCLLAASIVAASATSRGADENGWQPRETADLEQGELKVLFRDNSQSPRVLSGIDSLFNVRHAADFDAFDPDTKGASAGANFEHIIAGSASPNNLFAPRHHRYTLDQARDRPVVRLAREAGDDPWNTSSTLTYTLVAPNAIDLDFRWQAHDATKFAPRGYAVLFFANYMNDVEQAALRFRGRAGEQRTDEWIAADAPSGHADYNGGGTYRHVDAKPLAYDDDHNFKLNLWSYDEPRFSEPFYCVRSAHGMALIMMFDRAHSAEDEIRFSLFKFKLPKLPRPACDWQYVIHNVQAGREYGFRARMVWKQFVSAEDCRQEFVRWSSERKSPAEE